MPPGRPRGSTGRKQLTTEQRQRIRTLYFDAHFSQARIASITGASPDQVRYSIRAESATVAPRSGRPPNSTPAQQAERVETVSASEKDHSKVEGEENPTSYTEAGAAECLDDVTSPDPVINQDIEGSKDG